MSQLGANRGILSAVIHSDEGTAMTVCPIAIVAGCKKCPAFSICPLKTVLGDAPKAGAEPPAPEAEKKS